MADAVTDGWQGNVVPAWQHVRGIPDRQPGVGSSGAGLMARMRHEVVDDA